MKTMITSAIAFTLLLASCAVEMGDETDDEIYSEEESELGGLTCTTGSRSGTCTAASAPTGWTITSTRGATNMRVTSTGPTTASWSCSSGGRGFASAIVTATGVGSAPVNCSL